MYPVWLTVMSLSVGQAGPPGYPPGYSPAYPPTGRYPGVGAPAAAPGRPPSDPYGTAIWRRPGAPTLPVVTPPPLTQPIGAGPSIQPDWRRPGSAPVTQLPAATDSANALPIRQVVATQPPHPHPTEEPVPHQIAVHVPLPPRSEPAAVQDAAAAAGADQWALMRALQGTWYGAVLNDNRTSISGWFEGTYTGSTAKVNNQPVVWNDRANKFLLNQAWFRLERTVVTSGTSDITWGYRFDVLSGSDYRFSLMRGLLNSQLENSTGAQNLYGVDPIQFYANMYIPNLFQGTDIRAGRLFTPWGAESLEAVSTPFVSRSYAFNFSPPFTHMGIMVSPTFNANWAGKFMLANGNDVFFQHYQEPRFVGALTWTSTNKADTATFGWSIGRGKFNAGAPFNPATVALAWEPAGRNNFNAFDFVYAHVFNPKLTYMTELIYGYQTNVPANVPAGIIASDKVEGNAQWASWVQYLNYTISDKWSVLARYEMFDDFVGQRTGFEGVYYASTLAVNYKPYKWLWFRPEIRYDYNAESAAFEGKHSLLTAAMDVILRW